MSLELSRARVQGARRRLAAPRLETTLSLGIDVGATKVATALVDPSGHLVAHGGRSLHAAHDPATVLELAVASARSVLDHTERRPRAVGVAIAAQVDRAGSAVVHAPNLGWRDVPVSPPLEEALGVRPVLVNDARAAAYAEWKVGAGRGYDDLFVLSLGTGVGGSAVIGGRLVDGATNAAGEVGHISIRGSGRACHCPNRGCLEAYIGGWAIAGRAREILSASPSPRSRSLGSTGDLAKVTAETVFSFARAGRPWAVRLVSDIEREVADGVVGIVNAFNPALLVLDGGLVSGWPPLVAVAERAVRTRCQPSAAAAEVREGQLGENAAVIGAALLANARRSASP